MKSLLTRLLALALLAVALAGCTDEPDQPTLDEVGDQFGDTGDSGTDGNTTTDDGSMDDGNTTEDGNSTEGPSNHAPTASITASIEQGEVPFNVTFTFDATDVDGDALNWTLDVDSDGNPESAGSALPGNYTHTFTDEGTYTVTYTVDDGTDQAVQTITIDGAAAAAEEGPVAVIVSSWMVGAGEGSYLVDYLDCSATPASGATHGTFDIPAKAQGLPFTATLTATPDLTAIADWGFTTLPSSVCDGSGEDSYGESAAPLGDGVTGTVTGTIGANADFGVIYAYGGTDLTLTITVG